jgi:teichuronic acid biosynthesis glycosyltransferase TuaH
VFWAQDDYIANAELVGMSPTAVAVAEARLAEDADLILASTPLVHERWRRRGFDPVLIPYGCELDQYRDVDGLPTPSDVHLPGPIVGFVGHLAERIDVSLLEAIVDRGCSLLLVGARHPRFDVQRIDALLERPNVSWVGPKPFEELPAYLGAIDVGIVPYNDSPFNRSSFPMKTLEYLAAGRPVISTDLPATRWLDSPWIDVATTPAAFADAVVAAAARPRTEQSVHARRAFAAQHTWARRAEAFAQCLGLDEGP